MTLPADPETASIPAAGRTATASAERHRGIGRFEAPDARAARIDTEAERSLLALRNVVIRATSRDMYERGADLLPCLDEVRLAGPEKIRFAVEVESTPAAATTGRWRFVEIVDGEPLPDSFPACAARALGGGQQLAAPDAAPFPDYRGDLEIIYTIPAPPAE